MGNTEEKDEKIFIGARTLGSDEVKMILPTYDLLHEKIEMVRNSIPAGNESQKQLREYNNTFSILGKRGTGKTSVMYTIMGKGDSNKNEKDIMLPIIKPDNLSMDKSIVGIVLGSLKNVMEDLINEIKNNKDINSSKNDKSALNDYFFKNCIYKPNNKLSISYNDLVEAFCYREKEYKEILIKNYENISSYIDKTSEVLDSDENFRCKLKFFIEELCKTKQELRKIKNSTKDEKDDSLVFIFIDDIDLKTTMIEQVIDVLQCYTFHPRVVTVISSEYELLQDSLLIHLIQKDGGYIKNFTIDSPEHKNYFNKRKELTENYLKKVMPPAYRFELNNWNLNNLPNYSFGGSAKDCLGNLLGEFLTNDKKNNSLFSYHYYSEENNEDKKQRFHTSMFNMFDTTPRGLVNVYYTIYKTIQQNKSIKDEGKTEPYFAQLRFIQLKEVIDTIINSSPILVEIKDDVIYKEVIRWGNSLESSTFNLEFVRNTWRKTLPSNTDIEKVIKQKLAIHGLIFFIYDYYGLDTKKEEIKYYFALLIGNPRLNGFVGDFSRFKNGFSVNSNIYKDSSEKTSQDISEKTSQHIIKDSLSNSFYSGYISYLTGEVNLKFGLIFFDALCKETNFEFYTIKKSIKSDEQFLKIIYLAIHNYCDNYNEDKINFIAYHLANDNFYKVFKFIIDVNSNDARLLKIKVATDNLFAKKDIIANITIKNTNINQNIDTDGLYNLLMDYFSEKLNIDSEKELYDKIIEIYDKLEKDKINKEFPKILGVVKKFETYKKIINKTVGGKNLKENNARIRVKLTKNIESAMAKIKFIMRPILNDNTQDERLEIYYLVIDNINIKKFESCKIVFNNIFEVSMENISKDYNKFIINKNGGSCIFDQAVKDFPELTNNKINVSKFIEIIAKTKYLSENSYLHYGQYDAIRFFPKLKNGSKLVLKESIIDENELMELNLVKCFFYCYIYFKKFMSDSNDNIKDTFNYMNNEQKDGFVKLIEYAVKLNEIDNIELNLDENASSDNTEHNLDEDASSDNTTT